MNKEPSYLIINADDYGYFPCVSQGILKAAQEGVVTATGIFANSLDFESQMVRLANMKELDAGVHLNLTEQAPLTAEMAEVLRPWGGLFPDKFTLMKAVLTGAIPVDVIAGEWCAQIERCLDSGIKILFLNSHEHIHMLPPLFRLTWKLAKQYGIEHIRYPQPEAVTLAVNSLVRDSAMKLLGLFNRRLQQQPAPMFLGMAESGKLSIEYMKRKLPRLQPGQVYELMCHPGQFDANQIQRPELLDYHDWEKELHTLTHPRVQALLQKGNIRLIGYRHLEIKYGRLAVTK